jgi:alpha-mannosidase
MRGFLPWIWVLAFCIGSIDARAAVQHGGPNGSGRELVLQGYVRSLSGETILYHSPLPGERRALITRAAAGWQPIVWESEPVRDDAGSSARGSNGEPVLRFAWLAGLGCNLGNPAFRIEIGGVDVIPFRVVDQEHWTTAGEKGSTLSFRGLMRDHYGDRFGLMTLDLPRGSVPVGDPLRLSITGEQIGSQAWVMTFEEPLEEGIVATPLPLLLRRPAGGMQPVELSILRLGEPAEAVIRAEGIESVRRPIPFGLTNLRIEFPPVSEDRLVAIEVEIDHALSRREVTLRPVRPWTIHLVQHTHTDIGYTRPQTEILADHLRYIDYALDYCDATDSLPEDARFRWTCEVSWPVHEYLRVRPPAQIERLKRRVREGRIELTAMPLNMGEVADERVLAASLRWLAEAKEAGLPVPTAMQNDVNGFAWSMLDPLADLGVRYVTMGENTHRAMKPFDVPTVFRWESPSGTRLLAYRSDHYMTANFWGILDRDLDRLGTQMVEYLRGLEAAGVPGNSIAVQYVGYFTDNAPPSTFANRTVQRWNDEVIWPHLRTSTMSAFLSEVERDRGQSLPVYRAAWPDWWTDGFASAMRETAAVRRAQADQTVNLGLLSVARMLGDEIPEALLARAEAIDDLLVFYDEHTFGASESVTDPMAENSQVQWLEKASYAWQAVMQTRQLREGIMGLLEPHMGANALPTITVFNTLNWSRSGSVALFIDHQLLPRDAAFAVIDEAGRSAAMQRVSSRMEGSVWNLWAKDVPAFGMKTYRIRIDQQPEQTPSIPEVPNGILENAWYRIEIDPSLGGIVSLVDKKLRLDLVDPNSENRLGEAIYERLGDRASMERHTLGRHTRTSWRDVSLEASEDAALWTSVVMSGHLDGFERIRCEVRLYKTEKRVELVYEGRKLPVIDPEALYVALPFSLPGGQTWFEAQGAEIAPGAGQLRGTSNDWNTVQSYAAIRGDDVQIVLTSDEAPLMQFGGINTGRYDPDARPATNRIYSFVLNNYWVTNFRASQEGDLRWSYSITTLENDSPAAAARAGWNSRIPLVGRVLPPAVTERSAAGAPHLDLDRDGVLLVCAEPVRGGSGVILQIRETAGRSGSLDGWSPDGMRVERVDPLGKPTADAGSRLLAPYATRFVRLVRSESVR